MPKEIEIKCRLEKHFVHALSACLNQMSSKSQEHQLTNVYFDTPSWALAKNRCALRIRRDNIRKTAEQTLKTAGASVDGVATRGEWNWPLEQYDSPLCRDVLIDLKQHIPLNTFQDLKPVFETNFHRCCWQITWQSCELEVAIDVGHIVNLDKEHQSSITELEVEVINTSEDINTAVLSDVLLGFLEQLSTASALWISDISKAQRGYELIGHTVDWPSYSASSDIAECDGLSVDQILLFLINKYLGAYRRAMEPLIFCRESSDHAGTDRLLDAWSQLTRAKYCVSQLIPAAVDITDRIATLPTEFILAQKLIQQYSVEYLLEGNNIDVDLSSCSIRIIRLCSLLRTQHFNKERLNASEDIGCRAAPLTQDLSALFNQEHFEDAENIIQQEMIKYLSVLCEC